MSRTFRKPSKLHKGIKKVKDGTYTKMCPSCENNGGCSYCEGNRLHKHKKKLNLKESLDLEEI